MTLTDSLRGLMGASDKHLALSAVITPGSLSGGPPDPGVTCDPPGVRAVPCRSDFLSKNAELNLCCQDKALL